MKKTLHVASGIHILCEFTVPAAKEILRCLIRKINSNGTFGQSIPCCRGILSSNFINARPVCFVDSASFISVRYKADGR